MLRSVLTSLLVPWFSISYDPRPPAPAVAPPALTFQLRHQHAVSSDARVLFADVTPTSYAIASSSHANSTYTLRTRPVTAHRPPSFAAHATARDLSRRRAVSADMPWDPDVVPGPDTDSRETLQLLAKMTNDAYLEPGDAEWYDLGERWNASYNFGWEPDDDGFRGYVFATPNNSTVVLSIKGTSAGVLGSGGPTKEKDKLNDNLLFSCCCARVGWSWTPVCDCYRGSYKCDQNCVEDALIEESLFYPTGTNLYNNLTALYPDSNIWITGHSLGGALASLVGVTFGAPVVTFEAPGERMAARRLHLPRPPIIEHITHVYHTADPIAMGTCNGVFSSCALGGYAMESRCHLGQTIVFDTVSNLSWAVDIRTHTIRTVIEKVLAEPWAPSEEVGREVPEPRREEDDCIECYSWEYGDFPE